MRRRAAVGQTLYKRVGYPKLDALGGPGAESRVSSGLTQV